MPSAQSVYSEDISFLVEKDNLLYCSGEVIESTYICDNSIFVKSGISGFHMRPLAALIGLINSFYESYGIGLTIKIGDTEYNSPFSIINLFQKGVRNGKEIIIYAKESDLTQELLTQLQNEIISIDSIGESVPNAIRRIIGQF